MPSSDRVTAESKTPRQRALTFALRKENVSIDEFERFVRETKAVLKNVSRAALQGSGKWVLTDLRYGSAVMSYAPSDLNGRTDVIEHLVLDGFRAVETASAKPPFFSERALAGIRRLSLLGDGLGVDISLPNAEEVLLSRGAAANVDVLLRPARRYYGSIVGNLDVVSVHKTPYVTVYADHGDVVRCFLGQGMIETAKDFLGGRVIVPGEITANRLGDVVSILAEAVYEAPSRHKRSPSLTAGSLPQITCGLSIGDYLAHLWSGDAMH